MSREKLLINNPKSNNSEDMSNKRKIEIASLREIGCDNAPFEFCNKYDRCDDCPIDRMANALYNAGYRKVIHCKDCAFCEVVYPVKMIGKEAEEVWYCRLLRQCTRPDVFCSCAKMKGGAE